MIFLISPAINTFTKMNSNWTRVPSSSFISSAFSLVLFCRCVVIEDSQIGLRAAKAAGMHCIVTESRYTAGEDFDSADAVVDCIGDAGEERFSLEDLATPGKMP